MANLRTKDGAGNDKYLKASGAGTDLDPNIVEHSISGIAAGANRIGKITVRNSADAADIDPLAEGTFTGRIGEVQASPTANTLLARLKDLLTGIVLAAGANIVGAFRDAGPYWTPAHSIVDSGDANTAALDLTAAPTTGQKVVIDDLEISVGSTAMTVTVKEETTGNVLYKLYMPANSTEIISSRNGRKHGAVDKKVQIQTSAVGNIFAHCSYHSEA